MVRLVDLTGIRKNNKYFYNPQYTKNDKYLIFIIYFVKEIS